MSATDTANLPDYAPVPASALGPAPPVIEKDTGVIAAGLRVHREPGSRSPNGY